jgi:GR25 family glycosyltransferase involved in LPS biosynthesis
MSHLKCIKIAKEKGWPNVVIIEDDIEFLNPPAFRTQLNAFLTLHQNNFDVCLLAGNVVPPFTKIDDCCIRVNKCQTTTGYIVNANYYDILIQNYSEGIKKLIKEPENHRFYAIDKWWFQLQERDRWMLIVPLTVSQREDYSDIEDRTTNYHRVMLDLEKKWMFTQNTSDFHNINVNSIKNEIKNITIPMIGLPPSLPNIQTKKKIIKKNMNSIITG